MPKTPAKKVKPADPAGGGGLAEAVLANLPHAWAVLDAKLRLVTCNGACEILMRQAFGGTPQPGQPLVELLPQPRRPFWQARLSEVLAGQSKRVEETLRVEGLNRTFEAICQPLPPDRVLILFEDITAVRQRELQLENNLALLREQLATRETLLSVVSHDLRSPIFQLNGLLFLIRQAAGSRDEARLQMQAEDLEERIFHLTHTLDNLLSWSNLHRVNLEPQVTRFSLQSVLEHAAGLLKPVAQHKGVRIYMLRLRGIELQSDREMVAFMARNLINNAIKFSMQGGKVEITAEETGNRVRFAIADHGVGIPPERMAKLREGSQHFSEAGTWGERGTGLGLKLCYDFCERLGGSLRVDSAPGRGTVVSVELPQLPLPFALEP